LAAAVQFARLQRAYRRQSKMHVMTGGESSFPLWRKMRKHSVTYFTLGGNWSIDTPGWDSSTAWRNLTQQSST